MAGLLGENKQRVPSNEWPPKILHLFDLHLTQRGIDEDGGDALSSLRGLLCDCRHVSALDLIVVSAISLMTARGAPYELALAEIGALAVEHRIPQVYSTRRSPNARFRASRRRGTALSRGHRYSNPTQNLVGPVTFRRTVFQTPEAAAYVQLPADRVRA